MRFYLKDTIRLQNAISFLSNVETGKGYVCEIKKEARSNDQNAQWHVWIDQMAKECGCSPAVMKEVVKRQILGMEEIVNPLTGQIAYIDYHTSRLNKEQFSRLMIETQRLAIEFYGIRLEFEG